MTGETALHFAVSLHHGKAAEVLLKGCPSLVNEADKVCFAWVFLRVVTVQDLERGIFHISGCTLCRYFMEGTIA